MHRSSAQSDLSENLALAPTRELRLAIYRFVHRRVHDAHLAEDLTQEILLRAAAKQATVRYKERMAGWIFQIARHVIISHLRKQRPTEVFDENQGGLLPETDAHPWSDEEEQLRQGLFAYIRGVVESLPRIYREALIATDYEGLSQVELARREKISVSAAKSRVQRARATVRRIIEECCQFQSDRYGTIVDCVPVKNKACAGC